MKGHRSVPLNPFASTRVLALVARPVCPANQSDSSTKCRKPLRAKSEVLLRFAGTRWPFAPVGQLKSSVHPLLGPVRTIATHGGRPAEQTPAPCMTVFHQRIYRTSPVQRTVSTGRAALPYACSRARRCRISHPMLVAPRCSLPCPLTDTPWSRQRLRSRRCLCRSVKKFLQSPPEGSSIAGRCASDLPFKV